MFSALVGMENETDLSESRGETAPCDLPTKADVHWSRHALGCMAIMPVEMVDSDIRLFVKYDVI
jgi:hypothetical protein